jgi:hypothetical protein
MSKSFGLNILAALVELASSSEMSGLQGMEVELIAVRISMLIQREFLDMGDAS